MTSYPSPAFRLGIVTGLQFEADIARRAVASSNAPGQDGIMVLCSGPGPENAGAAVAELMTFGVSALLSFGVAGGCAPDVPAGTAIVATAIHDLGAQGGSPPFYTNREWQHRLRSVLLGNAVVEQAALASTDTSVVGSTEKQSIHADTGAAAVDMESATVARACVDAAIPFMALRVILDPADLNLPRSALEGFTGTGETDSLAVMKSTMRRPSEIIPMVRLAISGQKARKALSKTADAAAPFFGAI
jgi:adenosylhomocysteine nucleosidase